MITSVTVSKVEIRTNIKLIFKERKRLAFELPLYTDIFPEDLMFVNEAVIIDLTVM